jgi:hypothetical protein
VAGLSVEKEGLRSLIGRKNGWISCLSQRAGSRLSRNEEGADSTVPDQWILLRRSRGDGLETEHFGLVEPSSIVDLGGEMLVNIESFLFSPFGELSSLHFKGKSAYMPRGSQATIFELLRHLSTARGSFVSKTFYRIQLGRPHCRKHPEENSHERGNHDPYNGR